MQVALFIIKIIVSFYVFCWGIMLGLWAMKYCMDNLETYLNRSKGKYEN